MRNEARELACRLATAQTEDEVTEIMASHPLLCQAENWKPYGGKGPEHSGIIFSQQSHPVAALTEKLTNSIDAVLVRECLEAGIDPEGPQAPQTMAEAVERFFGMKGGDFSEVSAARRRQLAARILVIADGPRDHPNIAVVDDGEGQRPEDFENTLLSLVSGNKLKIPFVQGKYNMGGTGALPYCGDRNYQLVLSRRAPSLCNNAEGSQWGFTLVRRHFPEIGEKSSYYQYCVDSDGNIFEFPGEPLDILPKQAPPLGTGTYIKLYGYALPTTTVVTLDLWRELNRRLYAPALPITIWETRNYRGHSPSKLLLGNRIRTTVDERNNVEESIAMTAELGASGKRDIEVTIFKPDTRRDDYASPNEAVLFTVNGQTLAALSRSFLKTRCRLGYLAEYMLVHIDCTTAEPKVHELLFMASRDRMRESEHSRRIEEALAAELENHEELRALNELRREQQIAENPREKRFLENVVTRLLKRNKALSRYLRKGGKIKAGVEPGKRRVKKFKGQDVPTFLRLPGANGNGYKKEIPLNSFAVVRLETDACDEYLTRNRDKGKVIVEPDVCKSYHLWSGILTVKLTAPTCCPAGHITPVTIKLTRPDDEPLLVALQIQVTPVRQDDEPHRTRKGGNGKPRKPRAEDYELPAATLVYRERREGCRSWDEMVPPWDASVISKVVPLPGGAIDVLINMDSAPLHIFVRSRQFRQKRQQLVMRSYETSIYLHSLVLHNELIQYDIYDNVFQDAIRGVAKITLDLIHNDAFAEEFASED